MDDLSNITTAGGATLAWPVDDFDFADFSAGKVLYLSDIEPASQKWTPARRAAGRRRARRRVRPAAPRPLGLWRPALRC